MACGGGVHNMGGRLDGGISDGGGLSVRICVALGIAVVCL